MAHRLTIVAMFLSAAATAMATPEDDIVRMLQSKEVERAAQATDKLLKKQPDDPQTRFLKGLVLSAQNKPTEAIDVFKKLTEDYPRLAEPYNNLAVLYAGASQFDKAIAALESAISVNPSYVTARENLGDVYLRMAAASYDKAVGLSGAAEQTRQKLEAVRRLLPPTSPSRSTNVTNTNPAALTPAASTPVDAVPPRGTAGSSLRPTPEKTTSPSTMPAESEVTAVINAWAAAWAAKDVKGYLAFYADDFNPPDGDTRATWERKRRERVGKAGSITLKLENLNVTVADQDAFVEFLQHYRSGNVKSTDHKTLTLAKRNGKWLIVRERAVTSPNKER